MGNRIRIPNKDSLISVGQNRSQFYREINAMTADEKNKRKFQTLYRRYISNDLSPSELDEMMEIMDSQKINELVELPLKETWPEEEEEESEVSVRSRLHWRPWSIAAGFLVLISIGIFWNRNAPESGQIYTTGNGETKEVVLSDGSVVLLNANTTLHWNEDWIEAGLRKLSIQGEAFFDIAHNAEIPLQVETDNATIEVLGTSFNVRNVGQSSEVFLREGKIKLNLPLDAMDEEEIIMEPGDYIKFNLEDQSKVLKSDVAVSEVASWTEGALRYVDQPLGWILEDLGRIYGKKFVLEDTVLANIPMDVGFPYANWEVMNTALELSLGIQLIEEGNTILVQTKK